MLRAMILATLSLLAGSCASGFPAGRDPADAPAGLPVGARQRIEAQMQAHGVPGLAVALVSNGTVTDVATFGLRDREAGLPLTPQSVMAGMSWTKFLFAAYVAQLAREGRIDLDRSIGTYLPRPLPAYPRYRDLAGDERWRALTLRLLLSHRSGLPNYRHFPPNSDLDRTAPLAFFQDPGTAYGYSGEGFQIAQLVVQEALGIDVAADLESRLFRGAGLERIGLSWKSGFEGDFDIAYDSDGRRLGHDRRPSFDAAGSVNGSIADFAAFVAAFQRGAAVSAEARQLVLTPQAPIRSAHQFPPWSDKRNPRLGEVGLSAGLGVVLWEGRRGRGFFKGGHDEGGDTMLVCLIDEDRCVLLMMNRPAGHLVFPGIVEAILGPTGLPWSWEYAQLETP